VERNGCPQCGVRQACLLTAQLTLQEVETTRMTRHIRTYQPRQILYHEGMPALGVYILCAGRVKLSRTNNTGRQQILRITGAGDICGEEALLEGTLYTNTAEALETSQSAFVRREAFLQLLETGGRVVLPFLRHICQVLIDIQVRFTHVALSDARTRLAAQLLDLAERDGKPGAKGTILNLSLRRGELAALVGLSPETAMRLLSQFQRDGLLETQGRRLTLKSLDGLRALL
jgi:CRP/FNR family transcriptional regulator, polysaccharide utilization system transcription regulator